MSYNRDNPYEVIKICLSALREIATTRIDTAEEKELHREIARRTLKEIGEEY